MQYSVLVSDYDGTLARDGQVDDRTLSALVQLREAGGRILLVTGRELGELLQVFPEIDICDLVVAENGALIYRPATRETELLCESPNELFTRRLDECGVKPYSVGRGIVATWRPHEAAVRRIIHELGLDLQVILNKDAVMILPAGVNKASGLRFALRELGLAPEQAAGVGDAENDLAFLTVCGFSVAVANAIPAVMEQCDWTTSKPRGEGVSQLIERMLRDDLAARRANPAASKAATRAGR